MNIPEIDKRSKQDIIEYIRKISAAHTPEWRFDDENPDVGTALALIYAEMYFKTLQKFNKTSENKMIEFFNCLNAKLQSSMPAQGYAVFGLSSLGIKNGVEVKSGVRLLSDSMEDYNSSAFETLDDVYVVNSYIQNIFTINSKLDIIRQVYINDGKNLPHNLDVFNLGGENMQKHIMYICDSCIFNITSKAEIEIHFVPLSNRNIVLDGAFLKDILLKGKLKIQYYSSEGFVNFKNVRVRKNTLILEKHQNEPAFIRSEINKKESFWIRMILNDIDIFSDKSFSRIECLSMGKDFMPDAVTAKEIEQNVTEFYPFGEKFLNGDTVYFASDEVLSKKGAEIELSFYLDFKKILIDDNSENPEINWKLIMKRSDVTPEKEYDITIENVIWEYFNGKGWARLFYNDEYEQMFHPRTGRKTKRIKFICPADIVSVTVNSREAFYIRARIIEVNNPFKLKGQYITPYVSDAVFSYKYGESLIPEGIFTENNTRTENFDKNLFLSDGESVIKPFYKTDDENTTVYIGFSVPPERGPIKFLFSMSENSQEVCPKLSWEYLRSDGWKSLHIFDETENFRKTGIISFIGASDFAKAELFNNNLYWIRIRDLENQYGKSYMYSLKHRIIENIWLNAVRIRNSVARDPEFFHIKPFEENRVCKLTDKNISQLSVYVDEVSEYTAEGFKEVSAEYETDIVYDDIGRIKNVWVKWKEVNDFSMSSSFDRHYVNDKISGTVMFGNGIKGRIPVSGEGDTIKIEYSSGGGAAGNLEKDRISVIDKPMGFVSRVTNPLSTFGGSNAETLSDAIRRHSAYLRTGDRGVTAFDYEMLAREAEKNILKVKCFSNVNEHGEHEAGCITLVIFLKDYNNQDSHFDYAKENIAAYIKKRMSGNIVYADKFRIVESQFIEYRVKSEIAVKNIRNIFDIKSEAERRISEFLNPISGNFDGMGWDIGVLPNSNQIENVIRDIKGISFIKNITVTAFTMVNSQMSEVEFSQVCKNKFAIAVNGQHDIIITAE